jgi:hypothetical protein
MVRTRVDKADIEVLATENIGCIEYLALSCMGGANDDNVLSWPFKKRVGEVGKKVGTFWVERCGRWSGGHIGLGSVVGRLSKESACDPKPGLMVKQIFFQANENS